MYDATKRGRRERYEYIRESEYSITSENVEHNLFSTNYLSPIVKNRANKTGYITIITRRPVKQFIRWSKFVNSRPKALIQFSEEKDNC